MLVHGSVLVLKSHDFSGILADRSFIIYAHFSVKEVN